MEVESLKDYLVNYKDKLIASIGLGKYCPNPVRRVEAIAQVLSPIYEPGFSPYSYGFRPRRSAHQALRTCQQYSAEGCSYAIDLDLEKFFDTVSHSKLIEVLSRKLKDGRVISLIHKYLNAGVMKGGKDEPSEQGFRYETPRNLYGILWRVMASP